MMKNHRLAKSISEVSWYQFTTLLEYKAIKEGKNVIKIGRFEPSTKLCPCGYKNEKLTLSDREWVCPKCGKHNDRDILAANNIKRFALSEANIENLTRSARPEEPMELSAVVGAKK